MRKWIPVIVVLAAVVASIVAYPNLSETVPTHWDLKGNVNGFSSRLWGAFGLPLAMVGMYALLRFLPLIDPRRENYAKFAGAYDGIITIVLLFLLGLHLVVLRAGMGHQISMQKVLPIGMGLLFVAIGALLPQARSNFFVGIRTPWTLSSEKSWEKTHRVGGVVFVLIGLMIAASAFFPTSTGWPAVWIVTAVAILGVVVYSYVVWRDDPDKHGFLSN